MNKKALIIDGNSLVYRAYYATENQLQYFEENDLFPTNALRLMIDLCFKLKQQKDYDYLIIAFDAGKTTFRTEMFSDYKAHRCKMPDALAMQLPIVHQAVKAIGFNVFKMLNIEADDIIGSSAKILSSLENIDIDVYSSDRDILQLVDKHINVNMIKKGLTDVLNYNLENFKDLNNGLTPKQTPDFKAIVGDKSDNIPGVKGIGEKTGIEMLLKYSTLESIYDNLDSFKDGIKNKLIADKDNAKMYKELATIKTDLYTIEDIDKFVKRDTDYNQLESIINEFSLKSLLKYLERN